MRQILLGLVLTAVMAGGLPMARTSIENFGRVAGLMISPGSIDKSEAVRGAIQQFASY
jgi:hypothetical protein